MNKKTSVEIPDLRDFLSKDKSICSLGSCFSDEIARLLRADGYDILINPFGVQYNPVSISQSLHFLEDPSFFFQESDIIERDPHYGRKKRISLNSLQVSPAHHAIAPCSGGYTSFYHHGSFSRSTAQEFLVDANDSLIQARKHFKKSDLMIITFGTTWMYRHIDRDIIVSNCHKHLAQDFSREEIQTDGIVKLYSPWLEKYTDRKWIFTVSPIRYKKDGLHNSQLSKARLLLAIDELTRRFSHALYFPSYEIILDELRDYVYYKEDALHPDEEAVRYIYDKITHKL